MFTKNGKLVAHNLFCICLVAMMLVSGCSNQYGGILKTTNDRTEISQTHSEFSALANNSDLPIRYVSEGKIGISKVEAALEEADAVDLKARAEFEKKLADSNARRSELDAQVSKSLSDATALRKKYEKEYVKAISQIDAREFELGALIERKDAIISSLIKENDSKCRDIVSEGREKFESENARIVQLEEIYQAIEVESNAKMLDMTEASKATRERASATVAELQAEAASVQIETAARVDELNEQVRSTTIQVKSEFDRLVVSRDAILKDSAARVKELRARADTIEANLANEEYQLKLVEAASAKAESQAMAGEKSASAPTRLDKAMAEIDALRGDVRLHQETAQSTYDSQFAGTQAKLNDELSEVKKIRVTSDRTENVARAEFVKAEAAARAEAIRQTATHAEAVAEAEKLEIIAAAEAEAARIKQEVLEEIAAKKSAKKVEMENKTVAVQQLPEGLHDVPATPQVVAVAPVIEPEHIAAFRISLANVMRMRAQAGAHEMVAEATFAEIHTKLVAVKTQQDAIVTEQLGIADALEAQANSRFSELETKTEKEMEVVESKYRQQVVQAESFRKEKEAEVMDYRSQAEAMHQIANARCDQLQAESEAVAASGKNDLGEMNVTLWVVQERGDAQHSKLVTEAQSIADSQEALALQIDAQIDSARRYLQAELTKIDNSIKSSKRIAQADYQQTMTTADALRQRTEAQISRTNAQFTKEHTISKAQIARDRELASSQNLRSEAVCERIVANARTAGVSENANLDALNATAQADMNIILAANTAKRNSAEKYLGAVKARFTSRIEQVKAERVVDMAEEYNMMAIQRTDLAAALAKASAAREDSNRKLVELQKKQTQLQTASMVNWSDKLAVLKNENVEFKSVDAYVPADKDDSGVYQTNWTVRN